MRPTTAADLANRGVTRRMLATAMTAGAIVRVRHGVYVAVSAWPEEAAARHLARARAEVAANRRAVISHGSAALAWQLPSPRARWEAGPVSVTVADGSYLASALVVHHVAALPSGHVEFDADGYAVTSVARTAIDVSTGLDLPEALVVLDAAARRLVTGFVAGPRRADYGNPRLAEAARSHLRDVALALRGRAVLPQIALAEPSRESAAESLSAGHFELAALPRPEFQAAIPTPFGTFFPDCLWRERRLIGECDGAVKYADSQAWVKEKQREQVLRDLGYDVVRWLGFEILQRPAAVVDRVARALGC